MRRVIFNLGVVVLFLSGCSVNNNETSSGTTRFNVYLTDAPGKYEEVLIDIQEVKVHVDAEDSTGGWQDIENVNAGIYNLLDFTNNLDTLLASEEFPSGHISQMRLVLGDNNKVKRDGIYYDLKTPSAQQSGLKLNIHADLEEDIEYDIWIDFDAEKSIVETGNGKFLLKPVIRTYTNATSGAIEGVVDPASSQPYILAISGNSDTVTTMTDSLSGYFMLKGLLAGEYNVKFQFDSVYQDKTIEDISVELGIITDIGTVEIEED